MATVFLSKAGAQPPDSLEDTLPEIEDTLPEILVEPEEPEPAPPPVDDEPEEPFEPFDLPLSYPRLSELEFEGLDSALRSTRSIFDDPRHGTIIDRQQLQERMPMDMIDALEREVGVLVQRTGAGQASPFVRGLTGPQTLILIDGIRLNNSTFRFGPNQYFATIDPGTIERIEVVRGPQSVLWGSDAIGGVINVVTRSARDRFQYDYYGGEFTQRFSSADSGSYSRANVQGSVRNLSFFGGGSYLNVRDLRRGGDLGRQPFTNYSQYAGDIKIDYLLNPSQLLTVSLQHLEQMEVPRTDRFPGEFRVFDPQQRDLAYVRWQGVNPDGLFDTFMVTGSLQRQKEGSIRRRPPESPLQEQGQFDVLTTGLDFVLGRDLHALGNLTWGADWYYDDVDAENQQIDRVTGAVTPLIPQFPPDSFYQRFGVFLQWDVDLTERLAMISGVRYSHINLGGTVARFDVDDPAFPDAEPVATPIRPHFQDWTSSVGLVYRWGPNLNLVGSVSEGFRAPGLDELTSVSTNINEGVDLPTIGLSPETSTNYEVGLKFDDQHLRGQIFYFWTDLQGLIDRIPVAHDPVEGIDFFQRQNIGRAEVQGLELAGEYLLTSQWSTYGNMSYLLGRNFTDEEPMSRIPPTQGVVGLRWRDEQGRNWFDAFGWLVRRQDRLSARDQRDTRIPPGGTPGYGTFNVRAGTRMGENQRLTLWLENIFDKAYRVHGSGVDGPGISANLGYELLH